MAAAISLAALRPQAFAHADLAWFYGQADGAIGHPSNFGSMVRRLRGERGSDSPMAALSAEERRLDACERWRRTAEVVHRLPKDEQALLRAWFADDLTPAARVALAIFGRYAAAALLTRAAQRVTRARELRARTHFHEFVAADQRAGWQLRGPRTLPWLPGTPTLLSEPPRNHTPSDVYDALADLAYTATKSSGRLRVAARRTVDAVTLESESSVVRAANAYETADRDAHKAREKRRPLEAARVRAENDEARRKVAARRTGHVRLTSTTADDGRVLLSCGACG